MLDSGLTLLMGENQEKHYREVRNAARDVQKHIQPIFKTSLTTKNHHWLTKYRAILSFDFEAAVYMIQWNDLDGVVEEAAPIFDDKLVSVLFDLVLSPKVPLQVSLRLLNVRHLTLALHSALVRMVYKCIREVLT